MIDIKKAHRAAMEHSDLAIAAKTQGDQQQAMEHFRAAYELEAEAANALINDFAAEPTRSVLFRSAATLARDCGLFGDAEKLIYKALAGEPPRPIAEELRDLLDQVAFERHLKARGVRLGEDEIQLAISGNSIGSGVAPTEVVFSRVRSIASLLYRTAERIQNRPYRDKGRIDARLAQIMALYMTAPRVGCFAVTLRIGGSDQRSLPGLTPGEEIVDEVLECLQLYIQGDEKELKNRIHEDAYYNNFVGLARSLQPDGAKIKTVGFTTVRRGKARRVSLTGAANSPPPITPHGRSPGNGKQRNLDGETVTLHGELLIADATKRSDKTSGEIEIVAPGGGKHKVTVPPGMMSDIVKPLWESEVDVIGTRRGRKIHLVQIRPSSDNS